MQALKRGPGSLIRAIDRQTSGKDELINRFCWVASARLPYSASSIQHSEEDIKQKLTVIPLPKLSPNMTSGSVRKWLKKPGEEIATYDVIMEVDTDNLSEDAYKVGDFAGTVTMLVEAQEDGFLSKLLVEEGKEVKVHTPVATMCESEETLEELTTRGDEVNQVLQNSEGLRQITWQSYLKESKDGPQGCS